MDTVEVLWKLLSGVLSAVTIWALQMILKLRSEVDIMKTEQKSTKEVVDHLTRTGENLKNEMGSLKQDITEVKGDIKSIDTKLEFIAEAVKDLKK